MRAIIVCAFLQIGLCYAYPNSHGVGAYAYSDSAGNRYGGTYDLPDALPAESNFIPFGDIPDVNSFFPAYFRNFEKFMEQSFGSNIASQRLPHAKYGYPGRVQYSPFFRFPSYGGFPNSIEPLQPKFGMPSFGPTFGPNFASNGAFASAVAGPGGVHQVASIDPPGHTQNIDVSRSAQAGPGKSNFYGVSSSSFASSSNVNGKVTGTRRAETVVNENGKITKYKVEE